jgi:PEP-CTERM motif
MRNRTICLAAMLALGAGGVSAANLVIDGDFEGGTSAFNATWNPHLTTGFPNDLGVSQAEGSDDPNTGLWFAWFGDGDSNTSYIEQTIPTIFDESYTLTFSMAIQPDDVSGGPRGVSGNASALYVSFGRTDREPSFPCCVGYTQPYIMYTFYYVATSASTVLEFAGVDSNNSAILLDTVSLVDSGAAPEPSTFALAGAGLLIAGVSRKLAR